MLLNTLDYYDGDYSSKSHRIGRDTSISSVLLRLLAATPSQPLAAILLNNYNSRGFGLSIDSLASIRYDLAN
jgi:hypothetical protein